MRPNPPHFSGASLMVNVGLVVTCFSQLPKSVSADSSASSRQLLKLLAIVSAEFSNEEQVKEERANCQDTLPLLTIRSCPVEMPLFGHALTRYVEETINGKLSRRYLARTTQNDQGLIDHKIYKILEPLTEDLCSSGNLKDLTMEDLNYTAGCAATYYEIDDGVFFGEFPDCHNYSPEAKKTYPVVITCNVVGILVSVANQEPETASHVSFVLKPVKRFQLPAYFYAGVDNYKHPCE